MTHTNTKQVRRGGFTLTELMISLAMVLLLVLAMTRIFGVTTRAISKGNAVGEATRGIEAVRTSLTADFTGTAGIARQEGNLADGILPLDKQPSIIITSETTAAFLNKRDRDGDNDGSLHQNIPNTAGTPKPQPDQPEPQSIDVDGDGADDVILSPFQTGRRYFRTDRLSFFTGGNFQSQTKVQRGTGTAFISPISANEGWVWYGHGRVYTGLGDLNLSASFLSPGEIPVFNSQENVPFFKTSQANPNNYYVSEWKLLRNLTLLKAPVKLIAGAPPTVVDDGGTPVLFAGYGNDGSGTFPWKYDDPRGQELYNPSTANPRGGTPDTRPLDYGTNVRVLASTGNDYDNVPYAPANRPYLFEQSRVDVAGVDAATYRDRLDFLQSFNENNVAQAFNGNTYTGLRTWYSRLFSRGGLRFFINPSVQTPLDPAETSQATAYLLNGAAQFVVEYAGDFLSQSGNGTVTATLPDGVLDFTVDANNLRRTRWYGLPRDVDGDGSIPGPGANANVLRQSVDVRPLADYVRAVDLPAAVGGGTADVNVGYPFERRLPGIAGNTGPTGRQSIKDYLADFPAGGDVNYTVAFGPGDFDGSLLYPAAAPGQFRLLNGEKLGPSLIRVIVEAVDADGKLEEPVSTELVFRVPAE